MTSSTDQEDRDPSKDSEKEASSPAPAEEPRDLTSIITLQQKGELPEPPAGSVMEDSPIEEVSDFESLEEYSVTHPTPEPPSEGDSQTPLEAPSTEAPQDTDFPLQSPSETLDSASGEGGSGDFPITSDENAFPSVSESPSENETASPGALDFETSPASSSDLGGGLGELGQSSEPGADLSVPPPLPLDSPQESAQSDPFAAPPDLPSGADVVTPFEDPGASNELTPPSDLSAPVPEKSGISVAPPAAIQPASSLGTAEPPPSQALPKKSTIEQIRQFSEKEIAAKPATSAAFPFSLLLVGPLREEEKARILDIISRENLGIRELDLEPQFESQRVLLPRISEYAAVVLVQALRGTLAEIKMGPSDEIFSTNETRDSADEASPLQEISSALISGFDFPAEQLPITTENHLPGTVEGDFYLMDTLSATATLTSTAIEAETSIEYQNTVESLQREIKFRAYHKGAQAILNLKIHLSHLSSPTRYQVRATGSAVTIKKNHTRSKKPLSETPELPKKKEPLISAD